MISLLLYFITLIRFFNGPHCFCVYKHILVFKYSENLLLV